MFQLGCCSRPRSASVHDVSYSATHYFHCTKKWSFPLRITSVNATDWWNMTAQTLHEKKQFLYHKNLWKGRKIYFHCLPYFSISQMYFKSFLLKENVRAALFRKNELRKFDIFVYICTKIWNFLLNIGNPGKYAIVGFCWKYMWNLPILLRREILSAVTMIIYVKIKTQDNILSLIFNNGGIRIENLFFILLHILMLLVDVI